VSTPEDEGPVPSLDELALSDAQWKSIKDSLAAVGRDAEQVMVQTRLGMGKWPLWEALPIIMRSCSLDWLLRKHLPSPIDVAEKINTTRAAVAALLDMLKDPASYNGSDPATHNFMLPRPESLDSARMALATLLTELDDRHKALTERGNRRGKNTRRARNEFWRELTEVWLALDVDTDRYWRRHLQRFLFECSKPFFPDVSDGKIDAFIDRYLAPPQKKI
jgi:hypothetical protein